MIPGERRYIPPVGARVRLRHMGDYVALGLPAWTMLTIGQLCNRDLVECYYEPAHITMVPFDYIAPPVGWQPRYTIHAAPDCIDKVLSWLPRGIVVRFSQYIGDGSTAFQPMDNAGTPHWKFTEVTDRIAPEDTKDLIRVVKVETSEAFLAAPCQYCNGTGIHTSNTALASQTRSNLLCVKCGIHLGFSFEQLWHGYDEDCRYIHTPGWCWPCQGSGRGADYIGGIKDRKARAAAVAKLEREGWKVWYRKTGQAWMMERETVVKEWGVEVAK